LKVEGKIVVSKNEIKRLIRSDHRNNPRNLLNVIFMNYIAACSFLWTQMWKKKGRIFLLQGNKLALLSTSLVPTLWETLVPLLSGDLGSFAHNQEAFTTSTIGNFPGHSLIILEHCITKHFNRMSKILV